MPETLDIAEAEKQYRDEWLLFEVTQADQVNRPVRGLLLCHSKSRDEIHQVAMEKRVRGRRYYLKFNGDPIPPGLAVVL